MNGFSTAVGTFLLDYTTKRFMEKKHPKGSVAQEKLNGQVELETIGNPGICGGYGADKPREVSLLTSVFMGILSLRGLLVFLKKGHSLQKAGWGLILGGGFGNLNDRIMKGEVTDFLRFPKLPLKRASRLVFNVADLAIGLGIVLTLIGSLAGKKKRS